MNIKIKFDGVADKDFVAELENDAKTKLRRAGLSGVTIAFSRQGRHHVINLEAATRDELDRAAKALGIEEY